MPKLREIQELFANQLIDNTSTTIDIASYIKKNQLENKQRLQIYQNNYRLGLTRNLAAIYPVVEKLVGSNYFSYCCNEFINRYHSKEGNLHEYGHEFADFLAQFESANALQYLPDVAKLEWAYHQVFHEQSCNQQLDFDQLKLISAEDQARLLFKLHPATRIIKSNFPIVKIWQINQQENPEPYKLIEDDYFCLITRRKSIIHCIDVEKADYEFLTMILQNKCFSEIVEHLLSIFQDGAIDLNNLLIKHVVNGNIIDFTLFGK